MAAAKLAVKVEELEKQLVALTDEVARLKEKVSNGPEPEAKLPWWEKRWGLFDNDPDYDKAMELGRKYRESLRPKPAKRKKRATKEATVRKNVKASVK